MNNDRFGLYLHIPFCRSKCIYCDFPSYPNMEEWQPAVIKRMKEELKEAGERLNHRMVTTVYMGGGTPSTLEPIYLIDLFKTVREEFPFSPDAYL